eukprot:5003744-Alexandrium_andersonii.AAC.1
MWGSSRLSSLGALRPSRRVSVQQVLSGTVSTHGRSRPCATWMRSHPELGTSAKSLGASSAHAASTQAHFDPSGPSSTASGPEAANSCLLYTSDAADDM